MLVQLAWWQRETVMVYCPARAALYAKVVRGVRLHGSPPRDIDGLQIESSDLRQVDGPHKLELQLVAAQPVRRRACVPGARTHTPRRQEQRRDSPRAVAARLRAAGTVFATGLAPRSTQAVIVRLDTGEAVAANYRVQVFYP